MHDAFLHACTRPPNGRRIGANQYESSCACVRHALTASRARWRIILVDCDAHGAGSPHSTRYTAPIERHRRGARAAEYAGIHEELRD